MVSTSIVTTQLIERRERSRLNGPSEYNNYTSHRGSGSSRSLNMSSVHRSFSIPSCSQRASANANNPQRKKIVYHILGIGDYGTRPAAVQIATKSIVLQGNEQADAKREMPVLHLRRASLTRRDDNNDSLIGSHSTNYIRGDQERNAVRSESNTYNTTTTTTDSKTNNDNDKKKSGLEKGYADGSYSQRTTITLNDDTSFRSMGSTRDDAHRPRVSFEPTLEHRLQSSNSHVDTYSTKERESTESSTKHHNKKVIAFLGATPFSIHDLFECIEANTDFSNLQREQVAAMVVGNRDVDDAQLDRFANLRIVLPLNPLHSTQLCTNRRYRVESIAANEWINDAADTTLAMILNLFRRTSMSPDSRWMSGRRTITHSVLGIVGLGRVGLAVLDRARRFQFDIAFFDPTVQQGMEVALGVKRAPSLPELLAMSDCVTLHIPLNNNTRHTVDSHALQTIKKGCLLVNNSSCSLVDSAALSWALTTGRLAAAALNYYDAPTQGLWNCAQSSNDLMVEEGQKDRVKRAIVDTIFRL